MGTSLNTSASYIMNLNEDNKIEVYSDNNNNAPANNVLSVAFTDDNKYFITCGTFSGAAKLYSFNNKEATYISDIKSDTGSTALNGYVESISFTSDDKYFIIGGYFAGRCKLYSPQSVSGLAITDSEKYIAYDNTVKTYNNEPITLPIASVGNVSLPPTQVEMVSAFIMDKYVLFLEVNSGKLHYFKIENNTLIGIETIQVPTIYQRVKMSISKDYKYIMIASVNIEDNAILYKFINGKIIFYKNMSSQTACAIIEFLPVNCGDTYLGWTKTSVDVSF